MVTLHIIFTNMGNPSQAVCTQKMNQNFLTLQQQYQKLIYIHSALDRGASIPPNSTISMQVPNSSSRCPTQTIPGSKYAGNGAAGTDTGSRLQESGLDVRRGTT